MYTIADGQVQPTMMDGCSFAVFGHCAGEQQTPTTSQSVVSHCTNRVEASRRLLRIWLPCAQFWKWSGVHDQFLVQVVLYLLEKAGLGCHWHNWKVTC